MDYAHLEIVKRNENMILEQKEIIECRQPMADRKNYPDWTEFFIFTQNYDQA